MHAEYLFYRALVEIETAYFGARTYMIGSTHSIPVGFFVDLSFPGDTTVGSVSTLDAALDSSKEVSTYKFNNPKMKH